MQAFVRLLGTVALAGCLLLGSASAWAEERQESSFESGLAIGSGLSAGDADKVVRQRRSDGHQLLASWRAGSSDLGAVSLQELVAVANGAQRPYRIAAEGIVEKVNLSDLMADARWRKKVSESLWRSQD